LFNGFFYNLELSPDGKYTRFNEAAYESTTAYLINNETGEYVFGDKGDIWIVTEMVWSQDNKNYALITDSNHMSGKGDLSVVVSKYNNPDQYEVIWKSDDPLSENIKNLEFISAKKIKFEIISRDEIVTELTDQSVGWEYDLESKELKQVEKGGMNQSETILNDITQTDNNKIVIKEDGVYMGDFKLTVSANGEMQELDKNTFKQLNEGYFQDKNGIYWNTGISSDLQKLEGADPETFKPLSVSFAKNKNNAYAGERIIEGADVKTFQLSAKANFPLGSCAMDKNREYSSPYLIEDFNGNSVNEECQIVDSSR
jgi:hypothetical protein